MKKIVFGFSFFFLLTSTVAAQEKNYIAPSVCEDQGGSCNYFFEDSCESNQDHIGICDRTPPLTNGACCKNKDIGVGDTAAEDQDLDSGEMRIIGDTKCAAPIASGGFNGVCRNPAAVSGVWNGNGCYDSEIVAGWCSIKPGIGVNAQPVCCVPKEVGVRKDVKAENLEGLFMTASTCTQNGGTCVDIDDTDYIPGQGFLDTKDPTCRTASGAADPSKVVVALCGDEGLISTDLNDAYNGCCVPKEGDYCKKVKEDTGSDLCTTAGIGGDVTPLEYGDYTLLEQIPGSSNTSGELQPYLESIYKAGFVLIVIGAIFMITVGGFTYMASAGNTAMIKKGKGMITDAVIGLVIALCIWLILNIINPDLVNLKIDPLPGISFDPGGSGATTANQNSVNEGSGGRTGTFAAKLYPDSALYTDSEARVYLSQNGVGVNKSDCSSPTQTNCTSLGRFPGIMAGTAAGIKKACNCEVTITGGTEAGHSTHGKGRAAMDMRKTSALDTFFSTKGTPAGSSGGKPIYQYGKVKVWFEDNAHYHIWEPAN